MSFLDLFKKFVSDFRLNLSKLSPAEQFEAGSAARWAVQDMAQRMTDLDNLYPQAEAMAVAAEKLEKDLADAKGELAGAIAEKKVILAADHENAITAAKAAARDEVTREFAAAAELATKAEAKRATLKDLPAATVAALTAESLVGANAESTLAKVAERVKLLTDSGISAEAVPALFEQAATAEDAAFKVSAEIAIAARKDVKPVGVTASKTEAKPTLSGVTSPAAKKITRADLL